MATLSPLLHICEPPATPREAGHGFPIAGSEAPFAIQVFFDGDCPLCMREINMLRRRDAGQRIRFTDIAASDFDSEATGKTFEQLMAEIHARLPDGTWVIGVDVFRRLYAAVGLGWLMAPTAWPGIKQLADVGYRIFARNRLRLTGRCLPNGSCRIQKS